MPRCARRSSAAIATIFAGTLAALVVVWWREPDNEVDHVRPVLLGEVLVSATAMLALGARSWRPALGRAPAPGWLETAIPVAQLAARDRSSSFLAPAGAAAVAAADR